MAMRLTNCRFSCWAQSRLFIVCYADLESSDDCSSVPCQLTWFFKRTHGYVVNWSFWHGGPQQRLQILCCLHSSFFCFFFPLPIRTWVDRWWRLTLHLCRSPSSTSKYRPRPSQEVSLLFESDRFVWAAHAKTQFMALSVLDGRSITYKAISKYSDENCL